VSVQACAIFRSTLATLNFCCHINGRKYDRLRVLIFGVVLRLVQQCEIIHSDIVCLLASYVILRRYTEFVKPHEYR